MNFNKKLNKMVDKTPPLVIGTVAILLVLLLPLTILFQSLGWKTSYFVLAFLMIFVVIKFAFWINRKSNLIKIEVNKK